MNLNITILVLFCINYIENNDSQQISIIEPTYLRAAGLYQHISTLVELQNFCAPSQESFLTISFFSALQPYKRRMEDVWRTGHREDAKKYQSGWIASKPFPNKQRKTSQWYLFNLLHFSSSVRRKFIRTASLRAVHPLHTHRDPSHRQCRAEA